MESTNGAPGAVDPREQVNLPSILLMVASGLTLAYLLVSLVRTAEIPPSLLDNPQMTEQARDMIAFFTSAKGRLLVIIPFVLFNGVIFFGALKMRNLQSYGLAMAAGVLACIPCCGPCYGCLGIPLGIWTLVVLNKPEVKSAFTPS